MPIITNDLECRLLDASILCYSIKDGAISPESPYYEKVGVLPGSQPYVFVDGKERINAGFVAETVDGWVIVAYRGSLPPFNGDFFAWVDDWLNDFRVGPMEWRLNGNVLGKVETGFGRAVLSTWGNVQTALKSLNLAGKKGILITGHSKGGGMTFPAATLVRYQFPHMLVQNCSFAAPLTCDRRFRDNYDSMGLAPFTVRIQNQFDVVPFLPWYPAFAMLSAAERLANDGINTYINKDRWPTHLVNEYVAIGHLRYLGKDGKVESGEQGQHDAEMALWRALEKLEFEKIVDAHDAAGRYHQCVCGGEGMGVRMQDESAHAVGKKKRDSAAPGVMRVSSAQKLGSRG